MDKGPDHVLAERLLADQLNWYRLQRHDFMNHWQVIMGYLQLKQGDKALAYLKEAVNCQATEQRVGQIPEPKVSAIFIGLVIRLRSEEIPCEAEVAEALKERSFWQKPRREGYAEALYGYTKECLALSRSLCAEHSSLRATLVLSAEGEELKVSFWLDQEKNTRGPQGESTLERVAEKTWAI